MPLLSLRAFVAYERVKPTYSGMKLYMFRTARLSIIRSLFTVHMSYGFVDSFRAGPGWNFQFHPGPARKLSTDLYDICTVNKLLMLDRRAVRNM